MSKTARLEVAIYMLEERIKSLEGSLREIRDIALASEGVEFYAMLADKALQEKMSAIPSLDLNFENSPTVWKFLHDESFVRGLMGPVGSGKSYGCAAEVMLRAVRQKPSPRDGIRYSRFVIVRNTYPELRTTTIKTWQELFLRMCGGMRWQPPISHHIKIPTRGDIPGIDCEVIFMALSSPQDVRKIIVIGTHWCLGQRS